MKWKSHTYRKTSKEELKKSSSSTGPPEEIKPIRLCYEGAMLCHALRCRGS